MDSVKVYSCAVTGEGNSLYYLDENDARHKTLGFKGKPIQSTWTPITVEPRIADRPDLILDFIDFGSSPTFSLKAVRLLRGILEQCGELLPLHSSMGNFYVLNVTNVIDVLDEVNSEIYRLPSGIATHANKYSFLLEKLPGNPIFKVPQFLSRTFYTSEFVDVVTSSNLKGFKVTEL